MSAKKMEKLIRIVKIHTVFLLLMFSNDISAQGESSSSVPDVEKVYLHTDRNQYAIGEDIWYKVYMVYAYTNTLFDNSNLLYVELISPNSEVIIRNITRMDLGLGHGDMTLLDTLGIVEGTYQLRAYTNWTRNFGDDFIFKKTIEIIDIRQDNEESVNIVEKSSQDFETQFSPEGGSLIAGVTSQVAFKSTYKNGIPCPINGLVKNSKGEQIAKIETKHDGMGSFFFTPSNGEQYLAEVTNANGVTKEVVIPKAQKIGYLLSTINHKGKQIVTIKTNQETLELNSNKPVTLRCSTRGIVYMEGSQSLNGIIHTFVLPTNDFPEGISQITLMDYQMRPHSERLIYVEKDHGIQFSVTTDKQLYDPREKVTLSISSKTSSGAGVVGSFSLSVTDSKIPGSNQPKDMNICSYFLMQSDIKGKVHNPGNYFDLSNDTRLKDLDLLLMTQGWRDFLWKTLPQLSDTSRYELEKNIKISGRLKKLFAEKPIEGAKINMVLNNKGNSLVIDEQTDDEGKFEFDDVMFKGSSNMMLSNQDKKAKTKGHLILDSLYEPPHRVDYKGDKEPSSIQVSEEFKSKMLEKHITYQVPLGTNDILLDELVVRGSKIKKEVNEVSESIYGTPDRVIVVDHSRNLPSNIFTFLQMHVSGLMLTGNGVRFARGEPLILLDGAIVDMSILGSILPTDIARIETLTNSAGAAVFGGSAANGMIAIYTIEGSGGGSGKKVFHSINQEIQGYYDARVFYAANYENDENEQSEVDIRNTLYWNPYIQPDETGLAEVSYFNSDVATKVNLVMEGITVTGIPLVVRSSYEVIKE